MELPAEYRIRRDGVAMNVNRACVAAWIAAQRPPADAVLLCPVGDDEPFAVALIQSVASVRIVRDARAPADRLLLVRSADVERVLAEVAAPIEPPSAVPLGLSPAAILARLKAISLKPTELGLQSAVDQDRLDLYLAGTGALQNWTFDRLGRVLAEEEAGHAGLRWLYHSERAEREEEAVLRAAPMAPTTVGRAIGEPGRLRQGRRSGAALRGA